MGGKFLYRECRERIKGESIENTVTNVTSVTSLILLEKTRNRLAQDVPPFFAKNATDCFRW